MAMIQQLRNSLRRKINAWKSIQTLYMPATSLLQSNAESSSCSMSDVITAPEDIKLWLPSSLCDLNKHMSCSTRLLIIEWELRYAQAGDSLKEIRQNLRLRDHMYTFKRNWIRGQGANTCTQNALSHIEIKAAMAAERYRGAHAAISSLAPVLGKVGWDVQFKVLDKKDDVHGMAAPKGRESEGRRQLSWIWLVEGVGDDKDEAVQDSESCSH